jgi:RES domain
MLLYRVTWVEANWHSLVPESPFHPLYVPLDRQGGGRFDNAHRYASLYLSTSPQGAAGETFGDSSRWIDDEIMRQKDGRPRCLVTVEIADSTILFDLDDPEVLQRLGIRPSDVVRRNRDRTQELAQQVWIESLSTKARGFRWWSYWRPEWTMAVLWSDSLDAPWFPFVNVVDVTELRMDTPAIILAADVLPRELG